MPIDNETLLWLKDLFPELNEDIMQQVQDASYDPGANRLLDYLKQATPTTMQQEPVAPINPRTSLAPSNVHPPMGDEWAAPREQPVDTRSTFSVDETGKIVETPSMAPTHEMSDQERMLGAIRAQRGVREQPSVAPTDKESIEPTYGDFQEYWKAKHPEERPRVSGLYGELPSKEQVVEEQVVEEPTMEEKPEDIQAETQKQQDLQALIKAETDERKKRKAKLELIQSITKYGNLIGKGLVGMAGIDVSGISDVEPTKATEKLAEMEAEMSPQERQLFKEVYGVDIPKGTSRADAIKYAQLGVKKSEAEATRALREEQTQARADAKLDREVRTRLQDVQKRVNKVVDPYLKDLSEVDRAKSMLEKGGTAGYALAKRLIARGIGQEVGALSDRDVAELALQKGLPGFAREVERIFTGEPLSEGAKREMLQLIDAIVPDIREKAERAQYEEIRRGYMANRSLFEKQGLQPTDIWDSSRIKLY